MASVAVVEVELCFSLPSTYPSKAPDVSVLGDQLSRSDITHLRSALHESAVQHLDQPMLMALISLASEELRTIAASKITNTPQPAARGDGGEVTTNPSDRSRSRREGSRVSGADRLALLHLDHMRAKTQYIKLIRKWVAELSLKGCLVFCQRLILILLQGPPSSIKVTPVF